jgi:hypothetical protein
MCSHSIKIQSRLGWSTPEAIPCVCWFQVPRKETKNKILKTSTTNKDTEQKHRTLEKYRNTEKQHIKHIYIYIHTIEIYIYTRYIYIYIHIYTPPGSDPKFLLGVPRQASWGQRRWCKRRSFWTASRTSTKLRRWSQVKAWWMLDGIYDGEEIYIYTYIQYTIYIYTIYIYQYIYIHNIYTVYIYILYIYIHILEDDSRLLKSMYRLHSMGGGVADSSLVSTRQAERRLYRFEKRFGKERHGMDGARLGSNEQLSGSHSYRWDMYTYTYTYI